MKLLQPDYDQRFDDDWIICDKPKFEHLVEDIVYFSSKLNDVIPATRDYDYLSRLITGDPSSVSGLGAFGVLLDASLGSRKNSQSSPVCY